jgi:hypothetical protein
VADWLADHLGKRAWWPLPQYAVALTAPAEAGALALDVQEADWRRFVPARAELLLDWNGVQGWQGDERLGAAHRARRLAAAIAQVSRTAICCGSPSPWRAAQPGSLVLPLVWGRAVDPADLTQWVPGMVGGNVVAQLEPHRHRMPMCWTMRGWTICRSGPMATGVTIRRRCGAGHDHPAGFLTG